MRGKKIVSILLVAALTFGMAIQVDATSIEEAEKKSQELEGQKEAIEAEQAALSEELNQIVTEMEETKANIEKKQEEIAQKADELAQAQITENNQYESMKKRIKYMYENGNTQFIEILCESKSIGDFLNNAEYISQISEYDRNMLVEFQKIVKDVERQQAELEEENKALEVLQTQLVEEQNSVSTMLASKSEELGDIEAAIGENASKLAALKQAAADAERMRQEAANLGGGGGNGGGGGGGGTAGPSYQGGGSGVLQNPCPSAYISSEFGGRNSPGGIGSTNHKGRDYAAGQGAAIYAAASGTVTTVGYSSVRGNYVVINHGNLATWYQHCSQVFVSQGQSVGTGQHIAAVGSTGASTGPHLHFEVHVGGTPVDPRLYL